MARFRRAPAGHHLVHVLIMLRKLCRLFEWSRFVLILAIMLYEVVTLPRKA